MNKHHLKTLKYLLSGILLFAAATTTHAQTAGNGGNAGDSTKHFRHHPEGWSPRDRGFAKGDSTKRWHGGPGGFQRGGRQNFGRDDRQGYAHRGFGNRPDGDHRGFGHGFGHGRGNHNGFAHRGFGGPHIRYTPEQRRQLATINKEYRQKRADLYKQDNLTLKQYKAGLLALEKEKKGKQDALITPQQKDEMAANRKRMAENIQVREVAHLERLKLHLNLTDDQIAKIKAGNEALRSQAKAIHENDNLLPEQKMEQMKALMNKRNDTYKAVLTPDQYSQFEKMMSHRRAGGEQLRGSRAI